MMFDIVAAMHVNGRVIGANGKIPWKSKTDLEFFKNLTLKTSNISMINAVIMGRKTADSLPCHGLRERVNIVISSKPYINNNFIWYDSFDKALIELEKEKNIEKVFVIGGESIYKQALQNKKCRNIYLNLININCDLQNADTFFPEIDEKKFKIFKYEKLDNFVTTSLYIPF
jgi:dihydrofolate reductase